MARPRSRQRNWPGAPDEKRRERTPPRYVVHFAQDPAAPNRVAVLDRRTGKPVDSYRSADLAQEREAALKSSASPSEWQNSG